MQIKHSRSEIRGEYSRLIKIIKFHGNFFYLTVMGLYVGSIERLSPAISEVSLRSSDPGSQHGRCFDRPPRLTRKDDHSRR